MRTITLALALLVALLGTAGTAAAQAPAGAGKQFSAGQKDFAKGRYFFRKGKYALAAAEFQAAYDLGKDPAVLENIGESWDKAGDAQKAVDAYRRYVAEAPRAADR